MSQRSRGTSAIASTPFAQTAARTPRAYRLRRETGSRSRRWRSARVRTRFAAHRAFACHLLNREQRALERRQRSQDDPVEFVAASSIYSFPSFSSSSASASSSLICSRRAAAADLSRCPPACDAGVSTAARTQERRAPGRPRARRSSGSRTSASPAAIAPRPKPRCQPVPQLHGHQRIEPEVHQPLARTDGCGFAATRSTPPPGRGRSPPARSDRSAGSASLSARTNSSSPAGGAPSDAATPSRVVEHDLPVCAGPRATRRSRAVRGDHDVLTQNRGGGLRPGKAATVLEPFVPATLAPAVRRQHRALGPRHHRRIAASLRSVRS